MGRTIFQLLAAQAAGEPLSDVDVERLTRHHEEVATAFRRLDAMFPERWGEWAEPGTETEALRQRILSGLDARDAPELREIIHLLLASLVEAFDDTVARWSGRDRHQRQRRRRGGHRSGEKRREDATAIVRAVEQIKASNPRLTDRAVARRYLRDHDPAWQAGTDGERSRKLDNFQRLIRRARKKTADTN